MVLKRHNCCIVRIEAWRASKRLRVGSEGNTVCVYGAISSNDDYLERFFALVFPFVPQTFAILPTLRSETSCISSMASSSARSITSYVFAQARPLTLLRSTAPSADEGFSLFAQRFGSCYPPSQPLGIMQRPSLLASVGGRRAILSISLGYDE